MEAARTGLYFVPGLGTAYAASNAIGGAQTGDADKALMNSVAAVLPMGIGAAGKIASKVAPKTTARVTGAANQVAAKINTKIVQPINSKITSVIKDPNVAADAAQKIITDKKASLIATDKAAKNLPKAEAKSWKSPGSAVSEAEGILKGTNRPTPKPSGPELGGGFGGTGSGGVPKGPTLNYGPTGGVAAKKTAGVQRVQYMGGNSYLGTTQSVSGGRSLSGAQGAPRAQAGVMGSATRSVNGGERVGQSTATMIREADVVTNFGTKTTRKVDTQTPTISPLQTPGKTKEVPRSPYGDPAIAPYTPKPAVAPKPAPKPGTTPAPKPVTPPTPKPGTKPGVPPKPGTKNVPGTADLPGWAPRPGEGTKNNRGLTPRDDLSLRPGEDVTLKPGADLGVQPGTDLGIPTGSITAVTTLLGARPSGTRKAPPPLDPNSSYLGPVQSNWQDYRAQLAKSSAAVATPEQVTSGPSSLSAGSALSAKSAQIRKPKKDEEETTETPKPLGRSSNFMYDANR
jgi:hypothetical protein